MQMDRVTHLETFARAGYAARGLVYLMLGYLTLATHRSEGTSTVLEDIRNLPAGAPLLAMTAFGLAGYGIYRLYCAALDLDGKGDDPKGIVQRVGQAVSGVAHLGLCYLAGRIAFVGDESAGQDRSAEAARTALTIPGGEVLIIIVAAGFALAAVQQVVKAVTGDFMQLMDADAPNWTDAAGRIGYAARALVFAILAWNISWAAFGGGTRELTFQAALDALRQVNWLYAAVASGLLIFGVFSLVMARYRRIRDENVLARLRA
jgi:hypothetical protein